MSTPFIVTAASIALLGAGFAATEGTRSAFAIPPAQIVDGSQIADGAANCAVEPSQGDTAASTDAGGANEGGANLANAGADAGSCEKSQSPDQSETAQNASGQAPAVQTPTAFAPGLPLAPFIAVPAGAAGLAAAAANDSAG